MKLTGTIAPGQHDLVFTFKLPTEGQSERTFHIPNKINSGMLRVMLRSSSTMQLSVTGFPEAEESRNEEGQRQLTTGRDFVAEKVRAPEDIEIKISGIPKPAPKAPAKARTRSQPAPIADVPDFDTATASSILDRASNDASVECQGKFFRPLGHGDITITYAVGGTPSDVKYAPASSSHSYGPSLSTINCVERVFRAAAVPAFRGKPVTMTYRFPRTLLGNLKGLNQ